MEEAFEIYIQDNNKTTFKIKMMKLKILGELLDAEYKDADDYKKQLPTDPLKPQITGEQFDSYMTNIINGDGNDDNAVANEKLAKNIKTLRLIKAINFISADFDSKLKDTLKIKYTKPKFPPDNTNALYIFQLQLIINFYEEAIASLDENFTTTGKGAGKFLWGTSWYNTIAFERFSKTDNEQRYRFAILKRYMSIVRKYIELMLREIKEKNGSVDAELLKGRDKFITAFDDLKKNMRTNKEALELLDAYKKRVEAAYAYIKQSGGAPVKYKYVPTGDVAYILYNKKRIKRNIYVKVKGRPTKYCKINKEYVLLSKLRQLRLA